MTNTTNSQAILSPIETTVQVATDLPETANIFTELGLYPNPAIDMINVTGLGEMTYDVYNMNGERVVKKSNDISIDISTFHNGTYLLRTEDGQIMRFVKLYAKAI